MDNKPKKLLVIPSENPQVLLLPPPQPIKNKGGRPKGSLNPSKYRPEMAETVIELMSQGASKFEVAAELGISTETIYEWCERYEVFSDAIKKGEQLSQAWWENIGRKYLVEHHMGDRLNTALWFINMKNRFSWRDTIDVNQKTKVVVKHVKENAKKKYDKLSDEEINKRLLVSAQVGAIRTH